ncbi:hypothetical protein SAMN05216436_11167 [bacterium A37T11]|nr:hypothetical protein SAMN05216436_11167 [bacterium A37T11]
MGIVETVKEIFKEQGKLEGKLEGRLEGKLEGALETEEKNKTEFVTKLLQANKFTIAEITNFASVPEKFVIKVQADLAKKQKI